MEDDCAIVEQEFSDLASSAELAIPVAAIQVLLGVIKRSREATMHGLDDELRRARDRLVSLSQKRSDILRGRTTMSLSSGCDLMMRHATRTFLEFSDFEECKSELVKRGESFAATSVNSRERIAEFAHPFVRDGSVVMVHGRSRVATAVLLRAAAEEKQFEVLATNAGGEGDETRRELSAKGIPVTIILDAAVGYFMESVDLVLVGAEGVVENGGICNKLGTLVVACCAKALNKPFYVAAESYKFARIYPLKQRDLEGVDNKGPSIDYTPPSYVSLLFTDLGVLTPSAVSDELIRLYQ